MPVMPEQSKSHENGIMKQIFIWFLLFQIILTSLCPTKHEKSWPSSPGYLTNNKHPISGHNKSQILFGMNPSAGKYFQKGHLDLLQYWIDSDRRHKSSGCLQISMWMWVFKEVRRHSAHVYCRLIIRDKPAAFLSSSNQVSLQINSFKSNVTCRWILFNPLPTTQMFSLIVPDRTSSQDFVGVYRSRLVDISLILLLICFTCQLWTTSFVIVISPWQKTPVRVSRDFNMIKISVFETQYWLDSNTSSNKIKNITLLLLQTWGQSLLMYRQQNTLICLIFLS